MGSAVLGDRTGHLRGAQAALTPEPAAALFRPKPRALEPGPCASGQDRGDAPRGGCTTPTQAADSAPAAERGLPKLSSFLSLFLLFFFFPFLCAPQVMVECRVQEGRGPAPRRGSEQVDADAPPGLGPLSKAACSSPGERRPSPARAPRPNRKKKTLKPKEKERPQHHLADAARHSSACSLVG